MHVGITMFATDESMGVTDLAVEAEARGYHSLYIPEHTHIPTSRRTPPPTGDPELPEEYRRTVDPFVALAAAAARTDRILLGTGICLPAQRDPIVTAKAIATLDQESGGRFVFGIGWGWNKDEAENHGVDFRRRRAVAREHVLAMRELWTQDAASFDGEFVSFTESWSWPKPAQKPYPPILIGGGAGPKMFQHIAEYADGWIPIGGAGVKDALVELRRVFEGAGRDPDDLHVLPFGTLPTPDKLDYFESIGVTEPVLRLPSAGREEVLPILDQYAAYL